MHPQYPQAPAYPPQAPQAPAYPQYPQAPAYQQYPPQPPQYPQAPAYQPPPPPPATGSLGAFWDAPSTGGGPSWKFMDVNRQPQVGKTYVGIVSRPIKDSDVRQQTDTAARPLTYKDGRPKFVMVVPLTVQPSPEFPEGTATWWCKGQARDELARAMAEAGAPPGAPEVGAALRVTLTGTRPVPGMNPQYLYRVDYQRPAGAPPVQPAPEAPAQAPPPAPEAPAQVPQAPPPAPPQAVAESTLTPEQQALLAQMTGA